MSTLDELWAWISPAVHDLAAEQAANPGKSWNDLRAYFVERAGLREATDDPLAEDVIGRLDELSDDDRGVLLGDREKLDGYVYEIARQHADEAAQESPADESNYDEAAWQRYLVDNGAQWDGAESSWGQFREWFLYHAKENGVGYPATGLMTHLDSQSAPDRIATLTQYGVTIQPGEQTTEPAADESGTTEIRTLLTADPEFAGLPVEQQRQLLVQVRDALGGQ